MSINVLIFRDKAIKELENARKQKDSGDNLFVIEIQNGTGVIKFISCTYDGEIKNGKMEGKGVIHSQNGHRYEGEFKENKLWGKGTYIHKNGNKYVGEFEGFRFSSDGVIYCLFLKITMSSFFLRWQNAWFGHGIF
jgi:hypothetical protein